MARKLSEFFKGPGEVDVDKVVAWLKLWWHNQTCPICGNAGFSISEELVQTVSYPDAAVSRGAGYPMVMLICNSCGYTLLFNAVKMGLVKQAKFPWEK